MLEFFFQYYKFIKFQVYDGPNAESPLIKNFCGMETPTDEITSTSNSLFIEFITDQSGSFEGFRATYDSGIKQQTFHTKLLNFYNNKLIIFLVCGAIYNTDNGVIKSTLRTIMYMEYNLCSYKILAPEGKAIKLTFDKFNLSSVSYECSYGSHLKIYDGIADADNKIAEFCKPFNEPQDVLISKFNQVQIDYYMSMQINVNELFQINYTYIDARKFLLKFLRL